MMKIKNQNWRKRITITSLFTLLMTTPAFAQTIGLLKGPSAIPCAYLLENNSSTETRIFETFATANQELPKLLNGELDIGFLPPNVAAKVFTKNNGALLCLGITGNGNLYIISKDSNLKYLSQLENKTITCAGQGATPEYMLNYLLIQNQVKNVQLDFSIPNADIAPALLTGKIDYALVPEPFPTVAILKDNQVQRSIDIQNEFYKIQKNDYPITLLVVTAKYAKNHKAQIAAFMEDLEKAITWTVQWPGEAGVLVEKYDLGLKASVAATAIPNGNYLWKPAKEGKQQIENLLNIFLDTAPESIGEKLPDQGFYY